MSSLDRAFFRAYAKEQPSPVGESSAPSSAAEVATHFESPNKPQMRYRIERTHTPWGHAAVSTPHVDVTPLAEDDFDVAAEVAVEENFAPAVWAREGQATIAWNPAAELEFQQPAVSAPIVAPAIVAPLEQTPIERKTIEPKPVASYAPPAYQPANEVTSQEIWCLPGASAPESNYLAMFSAQQLVESAIKPTDAVDYSDDYSAGAIVSATALVYENTPVAPPVEAKSPEVPPAAAPVSESLVEIPTTAEATSATAPASRADAASLLADENVVFWEVDHYLFPPVCDRLLEQYSYFQQSGEKLKQAAASGLKVLGITGVGRGEGRSTLAICLARAAAAAGLKVGLADCDFTQPHLAQHLGLEVSAGWQSAASAQLTLSEVAIRSIQDQITLLPLTVSDETSGLSLHNEGVARVLTQAKQAVDVLILDLGPHDSTASGSAASGRSSFALDAAIVVWDRRHRAIAEAQDVARELSAQGIEAVGIAENFAP